HGTVTGGGEWLADGRHLLVVETVGASHRLAALDVDADTFSTVAPLQVSTGGATVSVSRDGRTALVNSQETDQPDDLFAVDVASGKLTRLTRLNPDLRQLAFGKVEQISWRSRDGRTVYGVLITPPDFRAGKRYPAVVHVHGGPEWAWWVGFYGSWHEWDQLLASHGVVVLLPNPRGSDGQGPEFVAANKGDWGGMDWQDILAGLDELVPTPEGTEFYNALRQQGVEAQMVIYPREPHGPRERMHQLDILTRVLAWYEAKLK